MQPLQIQENENSGDEIVYVSPVRRKRRSFRPGHGINFEKPRQYKTNRLSARGALSQSQLKRPSQENAFGQLKSSLRSRTSLSNLNERSFTKTEAHQINPSHEQENLSSENTDPNAVGPVLIERGESVIPITATLCNDDEHYSDTLSDKYPSPPGPDHKLRPGSFPLLVVQALSKYTFLSDVGGAELALRSLRTLSIDVNEHINISKSGGVRATLEAMSHFARNRSIQQLSILFLTDVSRTSNANKLEIGQSGGLQLLNRQLLDENVADIDTLERTCIALLTICDGCEYNAILSGVCGTIDAILKAMRRWKRHAVLQERSLDFLTTVLRDTPENATIMTDAGAVSEILSTIRQYATNLDVQLSAIRAACELARISEAAREDMGCSGLLEDMSRGLKLFDKSADYIHSTGRCIRYLAVSHANRMRFGDSPLAGILLARLENWRRMRRVTLSILLALANITFDTEGGKTGAARGGGPQILLTTLEVYAGDDAVVEAICRVLRNLSDGSGGTKRTVGKAGTIPKVANAMKRHAENAGVQEHACAMMINLSDMYDAQIRYAGLEQHLENTLARFHHKDVSYKQADFLFRKLYGSASGAEGNGTSAATSSTSTGMSGDDHCGVGCVGTRSTPFAAVLKMGSALVGRQSEPEGDARGDRRSTAIGSERNGERRGKPPRMRERSLSRGRSASNQKDAQRILGDQAASRAMAATVRQDATEY